MENRKIDWLDNLRALATIGVIFIHVSSDYQPESGTISLFSFWSGNIFCSLSRFSVPVFVMISGALLLRKEEPLAAFLKKRLTRLLYPFLFWSLIYILKSVSEHVADGAHYDFYSLLKEAVFKLRDGASFHFWYIYMIVGVYLFVPIIGKWIRHSTRKEQIYFLCIWLVTMLVQQPALEIFKPAVDLRYFSGFLGYLVLGYFLAESKFRTVRLKYVLGICCLLLGGGVTIFGTYYVLLTTGKYTSAFYEPLSPNILLYAAGIFLLFMDARIGCDVLVKLRNLISKYSYGIYLVHVMIFFQLGDYGLNWSFINPLIGIPLTAVVCLLLSLLIVFGVHKIPRIGTFISG